MRGFIKLQRKIVDWEWYSDPNTLRLFIHLLLTANYEVQRWQGLEILPGQILTGRIKLTQELNLSEQKIRTALNKLKSTNEITVKTTSRFSIITICKWLDYQVGKKEKQPTEQPASYQTCNQQITTTKEGKECEEEKNNISVIFDDFRQKFPGTKRGLKTELDGFLKKNSPDTISLLLPALEKEIAYRKNRANANEFVPEWKNLSTWINKRCWEQEYSEEMKMPTKHEEHLKGRKVHYKLLGQDKMHSEKAYLENIQCNGPENIEFINYID